MRKNVMWKMMIALLFMIAFALIIDIPSNKANEVSSDLHQNSRTYIIDAGHGGEDGGAVSVSGICESRLNLEIAIRLDALFHLMGCNTFMIRTNDSDLHTEGDTIRQRKRSDLAERVKAANHIPNGFLISIHQNYFQEQKYRGMQVFYGNPASKQDAEAIQNGYSAHISPSHRRLAQKKSGIYLLDHIKCNAVLIECGFLSNPEEELLLQSKDYQCKLCSVIVTSLLKDRQ